jgi:hypothetical protein
MARDFLRRIQRGVRRAARRAARALPSPENEQIRQRREAVKEAWRLSGKRQFAEAGEIFARLAGESLQVNELILAQINSQQALRMWIQAKQPARALDQARHILRIRQDSGRLGSDHSIETLTRVAADLRTAGFADQADTFVREASALLAGPGLSPIGVPAAKSVAAAAAKAGKLPVACPQCGGRLPRAAGLDEIECYYCGSVVRAG